jgi:hypothetical protein
LDIDCSIVTNATQSTNAAAAYSAFLLGLNNDVQTAIKEISSSISLTRVTITNVTCGSVIVNMKIAAAATGSSELSPQDIAVSMSSQVSNANSAFRKGQYTSKVDTTYGVQSSQTCSDGSTAAVGSCAGWGTTTGDAANLSVSAFSLFAAALFAWVAQKL